MKTNCNSLGRIPYSIKLPVLLAIGCLLSISAFAEAPLKVCFLPETLVGKVDQKGFDKFPVPINWEVEAGPPVTKKFGDVSVSISGYGKEIPKKFEDELGRLITRYRALDREQESYNYSPLYRCWVGAPDLLTVRIQGLKPSSKYRIKFYVYDYTSPEGGEKKGSMTLNDLLKNGSKPVAVSWDLSKEPGKKSNVDAFVIVETQASPTGEVLFAAKRADSNPILNGFELTEIP